MANRILFYTHSIFSFGGVQRVIAVIAKALTTNYEVTILTLDSPKAKDLSMYGLTDANINIHFMHYSPLSKRENLKCKAISAAYKLCLPKNKVTSQWYAKSSFTPSHRKQLITYINQGGFDVVIGVHIFLSMHLATITNEISAKTIGWMHNSYEAMFEKDSPYIPHILQDFCKNQLKRLDRVIVLSDIDKKQFHNKLQIRTTRIYNPLTIKMKGQADYSAKRFLSIGRMDNGHKGFDILIQAFDMFSKNNQDWCLDIVGEGPERNNLEQLVLDKKLTDRVHFHPFTKEIGTFYASSSVYILASRWEGFGLVLIEAMAYGHSIIASELPITNELLSGKTFASLIPVGDVKALSEEMAKTAQSIDLETKGIQAKQFATCFNLRSVIKEWYNICE